MATLDDLPDDQRAVLSLVLRQGRSYDEIAQILSIDRAGVRTRAIAALDRIGPTTSVPELRQALVTDYLLRQLPEAVGADVRARLSRPGAERDWALAISDQLEPIADGRLAPIPPLVGQEHVSAPAAGARQRTAAGQPATKPISRRGGFILLGLGGSVVLAALAVGLVALLGGFAGSSATTARGGLAAAGATHRAHRISTPFSQPPVADQTTTGAGSVVGTTQVLDRLALLPPHVVAGRRTAGIAEVVRAAGRTGIVIVAQGLTPNTRRNAYAVWLTDPAGGTAFLGFVSQLVSNSGKLTADGAMPSNASRYSKVLLTLETQSRPKVPGRVVLQGELALAG
jgi:hypothetical protein